MWGRCRKGALGAGAKAPGSAPPPSPQLKGGSSGPLQTPAPTRTLAQSPLPCPPGLGGSYFQSSSSPCQGSRLTPLSSEPGFRALYPPRPRPMPPTGSTPDGPARGGLSPTTHHCVPIVTCPRLASTGRAIGTLGHPVSGSTRIHFTSKRVGLGGKVQQYSFTQIRSQETSV